VKASDIFCYSVEANIYTQHASLDRDLSCVKESDARTGLLQVKRVKEKTVCDAEDKVAHKDP